MAGYRSSLLVILFPYFTALKGPQKRNTLFCIMCIEVSMYACVCLWDTMGSLHGPTLGASNTLLVMLLGKAGHARTEKAWARNGKSSQNRTSPLQHPYLDVDCPAEVSPEGHVVKKSPAFALLMQSPRQQRRGERMEAGGNMVHVCKLCFFLGRRN